MLGKLFIFLIVCSSICSVISLHSNKNSPAFEWQPRDTCIRGRSCLKSHIEFVKSKLVFYIQKKKVLKQADCPCPQSRPYLCGGRQSSYCSLSKEACDSFINKYKQMNSKERGQLFAIQKCGNDFTIIDE